jgi:hypothetical protein
MEQVQHTMDQLKSGHTRNQERLMHVNLDVIQITNGMVIHVEKKNVEILTIYVLLHMMQENELHQRHQKQLYVELK